MAECKLFIRSCVCVCLHMCVVSVGVYFWTHTCLQIYMHTYITHKQTNIHSTNIRAHGHTCIQTYRHTHRHTHEQKLFVQEFSACLSNHTTLGWHGCCRSCPKEAPSICLFAAWVEMVTAEVRGAHMTTTNNTFILILIF